MSLSKEVLAPTGSVTAHLEPWQKINWTDDQLSHLYTDWGVYLSRRQNYRTSKLYLDAALEIEPNSRKALLKRSHIKRQQAKAPEALIDCLKAKNIGGNVELSYHPEVNLEICDSLYESNDLEDAKRKLHDNLVLFSYTQGRPVRKRLAVVNENLNDALSDDTAWAVHRLLNKMTADKAKEPKYVKPDCDVMSLLEKEEKLLSPIERKRRQCEFKIYNQTYMGKCWMDALFLKEVRDSPTLLLEQSKNSTPYLKSLTERNFNSVRTFAKMLHTRCPKYSIHVKKYPNAELYQMQQQQNLFRIQYQTRRNMFKILRTIRTLIRQKELPKLSSYVEEVMGNYVTVKTHRIMPWKFEFIKEVYNYLGLARINEYKIPSELKVLSGKQRLLTLFKIPIDTGSKQFSAVNVRRKSIVDAKQELFKRRMARIDYRMRFAKYPIERSYLLHEAAQAYLDNNSFDASCTLARNSMDEAKKGNNYVWAVLSALIACKAHAILGKMEIGQDMLTEAFGLAKLLKNIDLCLFLDICLRVNSEEMEIKKALLQSDGFRRRRRSMSSLEATPTASSR